MFKTTFGKLSVGTQFSLDGRKVYHKMEKYVDGSHRTYGYKDGAAIWPTDDAEVMLYDYSMGERIEAMTGDCWHTIFQYFDTYDNGDANNLTTDDASEIANTAASVIRDLLIAKLG